MVHPFRATSKRHSELIEFFTFERDTYDALTHTILTHTLTKSKLPHVYSVLRSSCHYCYCCCCCLPGWSKKREIHARGTATPSQRIPPHVLRTLRNFENCLSVVPPRVARRSFDQWRAPSYPAVRCQVLRLVSCLPATSPAASSEGRHDNSTSLLPREFRRTQLFEPLRRQIIRFSEEAGSREWSW